MSTTHQLRGVFRPSQIAHLRPGVDRLHWLTRQRVPEADAAIGSAAARRKESYDLGMDCDMGYHLKSKLIDVSHHDDAVTKRSP